MKNNFFGIYLRRFKDAIKKTSFLICIWDVLKTSQKRRLFRDVSERSLRCFHQRRSDWDISKTSHAGWVGIFKTAFRLRDWHVFMWQSLEILNFFNTLTLKQIFWKTQALLKKLEYFFLVESTKIENATFPYKTAKSAITVKTYFYNEQSSEQ